MGGYGLVLGGGGAKGGYEVGVWKALKELNIPINMVAGTSVGALNGAMIVQGDYDAAYNLWTSISFQSIVKVEKELAAVEEDKKKLSDRYILIKNAIASGGLDISPLKQLLTEVIDEKKIRESDMDFGIVTFSLTDFKPLRIFKSEIPEGKMVDYLLASACFPAFKPQEIDSKIYVDGGLYDNIPVSLAVERGAKKIIAVDISGPGITRALSKKDVDITYIKNQEPLGGVLDFDGEKAKTNIELGYYDTLKTFGKLKGCRYYIYPSEDDLKSKRDILNNLNLGDFKKMYSFLGIDWSSKPSPANKLILDVIIRTIQQYINGKLSSETIFPAMAEITAEQLEIERKRLYTLDELIDEIVKKYESIKNSRDFDEYMKGVTRLILSRNQLEFDREIKKTIIEGKFLISYDANIEESDEKIKKFRRFIAMAFPKISIANMFISLILSNKKKDAEQI